MLLLLLLFVVPVIQAKEKIPYCPNGDAPKTDDSGTPLICLPGQSAKTVCGKGYSCFFSGYNYQCCPQGEDEENEALECPLNSLTVLDAVGDLLKCDRTKCPKDTMFCSKQGTTAICCESMLSASQESTPIKKDDNPEVIDDECPNSALTVLNDDGNPLTCSSSKRCPQSTMKCLSVGKVSICCEPLNSASSKEEDEFIKDLPQNAIRTPAQRNKAESTFNPLKYVESDAKVTSKAKTAKVRGEGDMKILHTSSVVAAGTIIKKTGLPTHIDGSLQIDEKNSTLKEAKLGDEDHTTTTSAPKEKSTVKSAQALTKTTSLPTTTVVNVDIETPASTADTDGEKKKDKPRVQGLPTVAEKDSEFEYKPHTSGGYALSEKPQTAIRPPLQPNAKKIARKFLIDQIKRGWPYDEQFYRPNEEVEFVRSGSRSIAAVHFPS